jgi:two-component system sensor histidine kinase ChiS
MLQHIPVKHPVMTFMVLCCLFLLILPSCGNNSKQAESPSAGRGVIDLSGWDFETNGSVKLDGEWEFYPGLLKPGDFSKPEIRRIRNYVKIPGMWKNLTLEGAVIPPLGENTYRLEIISSAGEKIKTISLYCIYSAYRVWINGVLADEKGMQDAASQTGDNFVFVHNKKFLHFTPVNGVNEIVLQVANYNYKSGGIDRPLELENKEITEHNRFIKHTIDMIIVGLLLFFAIYNLLFYLFRRQNTAALYTGLFCLTLAINIFNLNIRILSGPLSYPGNPYLLDYLTIILLVLFVIMTVRSIFPEDFFQPVFYFNLIISAVFIPSLFFIDFRRAEQLMQVYFILMVIFILYSGYVFLKAIYNRRDGAILLSIGFISLFAGGINDTLYVLWIIKTGNIAQYTMVIFCISITIFVARSYSMAMQKLSSELAEKNISLEKLDRIKDQFLANTSHELRTPLNGIIGLSESMIAGTSGGLTMGALENLSLIASSGHRLSGMVNDLLDMAKIRDERLNLNLRSLDLQNLCEAVIKLSLPLAGDKPVEIINSIPLELPNVYADENRIRQVLHNLVGNAIKFTIKGSIEISARVIPAGDEGDEAGMVELSVSDTGIGVPENYRESIFEAYSQVDSGDTRSYSGTGLGLAIAKQIVEQHGGIIGVIPGEECGSVFKFTLPAAGKRLEYAPSDMIIENIDNIPDVTMGVEISSFTAGNSINGFEGNPVILAVDDDPVNLKVLKNCLELKKCIVKTAADGISALEILEKDHGIDLVLLDIMMPVMSGYDVCRRIRLEHRPDELPVIMLTAKNLMSDIDAAFEAGANDYIVKPFHISELHARTSTILKLKNVRKSAAISISIQNRGTTYSFMFEDIIYITSSAKNTVIHTADADTELPVMLKDMIHRLPPDIFVRIHKSYVINTGYIRAIDHVISGRYRVRLCDEDDTGLPVGPVFLESLRKKIRK